MAFLHESDATIQVRTDVQITVLTDLVLANVGVNYVYGTNRLPSSARARCLPPGFGCVQ